MLILFYLILITSGEVLIPIPYGTIENPVEWWYLQVNGVPIANISAIAEEDSFLPSENGFQIGGTPMGDGTFCVLQYYTTWAIGTSMQMIKTFYLPTGDYQNVTLGTGVDNDYYIYINGNLVGNKRWVYSGCPYNDKGIHNIPINWLNVSQINRIVVLAIDYGDLAYANIQLSIEGTFGCDRYYGDNCGADEDGDGDDGIPRSVLIIGAAAGGGLGILGIGSLICLCCCFLVISCIALFIICGISIVGFIGCVCCGGSFAVKAMKGKEEFDLPLESRPKI